MIVLKHFFFLQIKIIDFCLLQVMVYEQHCDTPENVKSRKQ